MSESIGELFSKELGKRNNPTDLKSGIIGKVVKVEPVIVSIDNGKVLLKENDELEISEWFRFRCKLGKNASTTSMQSTVTQALETQYPQSVSCNASSCNTTEAISLLYTALKSVYNELKALKCELKKGDFVSVASLEETGKYILLDKVL